MPLAVFRRFASGNTNGIDELLPERRRGVEAQAPVDIAMLKGLHEAACRALQEQAPSCGVPVRVVEVEAALVLARARAVLAARQVELQVRRSTGDLEQPFWQ